jgi:hypothetical protein
MEGKDGSRCLDNIPNTTRLEQVGLNWNRLWRVIFGGVSGGRRSFARVATAPAKRSGG